MIDERELASAVEKIKESVEMKMLLDQIGDRVQDMFNIVLEDELTYDELLALLEQRLEGVYIEFAEGQDGKTEGENG